MSEPDEQHEARQFNQPPDWIATQDFALDDVLFRPSADGRFEHAFRGAAIGDVLLDDNRFWFARKLVDGEMTDWIPMRCVHEARAFIVSKIRTT